MVLRIGTEKSKNMNGKVIENTSNQTLRVLLMVITRKRDTRGGGKVQQERKIEKMTVKKIVNRVVTLKGMRNLVSTHAVIILEDQAALVKPIKLTSNLGTIRVLKVTILRRKSLHSKREILPRLKQIEKTGLPSDVQDQNHQKETDSLKSLRKNQRSQGAGLPGELYQRKGMGDVKEIVKAADHQNDKEGHLQSHEDTANHRSGEADHQGIVVVLQEGEVDLLDGAAGQGHHGNAATVISTREVTPKVKRIKGTQIMSK